MTRTRVRVLGNRDLVAVTELLAADPIVNLFVASRIQQRGLDPYYLGCPIWGFERAGELVAICHVGTNLVPIGADPEAIDAFARKAGPRRHASSIMGRSDVVAQFLDAVTSRWHGNWCTYRELRSRQPMMAIGTPSRGIADDRVRVMQPDEVDIYFPAAVKMYTEEVGVSPLDPTHSYRSYVTSLIAQRRSFGLIDGVGSDARVVFKSDIGSATIAVCQIQGVWLDPELRGTGVAAPAMAQVVNLARERWPLVTLYVNDFNTRARRLYERVGFEQVAEFATVLY